MIDSVRARGPNTTILCTGKLTVRPSISGRGAARLARLHGVQEVGGSNPLAPTD